MATIAGCSSAPERGCQWFHKMMKKREKKTYGDIIRVECEIPILEGLFNVPLDCGPVSTHASSIEGGMAANKGFLSLCLHDLISQANCESSVSRVWSMKSAIHTVAANLSEISKGSQFNHWKAWCTSCEIFFL